MDIGPVFSLMERYNLSINSIAHTIVILFAFGFDFSNWNEILGISIPFVAAVYALAIFVFDKGVSSVYPKLHPDVACQRCGAKKLRILNAVIKCSKCDYLHQVGKRKKTAKTNK